MDAAVDGAPVSPKAEVEIWIVETWASYKLTENWEVLGGARWRSPLAEPAGRSRIWKSIPACRHPRSPKMSALG